MIGPSDPSAPGSEEPAPLGIQTGHMKMNLINILNQHHATPAEKEQLIEYFKTHVATHNAVVEALHNLRR